MKEEGEDECEQCAVEDKDGKIGMKRMKMRMRKTREEAGGCGFETSGSQPKPPQSIPWRAKDWRAFGSITKYVEGTLTLEPFFFCRVPILILPGAFVSLFQFDLLHDIWKTWENPRDWFDQLTVA